MRPRSRALIFDHLPSNARRAAVTALSMSALSASATSASVSPVEGFGVVNVLPDSASIHCPSIMSWYLRGEFATGCADDISFLTSYFQFRQASFESFRGGHLCAHAICLERALVPQPREADKSVF